MAPPPCWSATRDGPVVAEYLGGASVTEEFLDRWRTPGEIRSKYWDDKFGEIDATSASAVRRSRRPSPTRGSSPADVDVLAVAGTHRPHRRGHGAAKLGVEKVGRDLHRRVGDTGAAQPGAAARRTLEAAEPGQVLALVVLADGAEVFLFRTTEALAAFSARPARRRPDRGRRPALPTTASCRGAA